MNRRRVQIPMLAGIAMICFLAPVLLHSCPIDGHDDACGSSSRCLVCTVFNHTILNPDPCDDIEVQLLSRLPAIIRPISIWDLPYQKSLPARAPPPAEWI